MAHKNQLYIPPDDFYLQPIYSCIHCRANLAHHRDLISKSFQGSQGRAYLFNNVINVGSLVAEERMLLTGLHYVADIYCECCSFILGWKYERAFEPNQRYKEGKYIIELANLIKDNCWDIECNKLRLRMRPIKARQLFDTDWNISCDSLSKTPIQQKLKDEKFLSKVQSKSTFIRELSRDFQQLFGISEKNININNNNNNNNQEINSNQDLALTDEISNSTMSTSIERPNESYMRMNSDSDNIDSLNDSVIHCLTLSLSDQKSIQAQTHLMQSCNGSSDINNSLNTSFNSSKGLLEPSCSSDKKSPPKSSDSSRHHHHHLKTIQKSSPSLNANFLMPFSDSSLSVVSGTSPKTIHTKPHYSRSRHKCRTRHASNVVNPQKLVVTEHTKRKLPPATAALAVSMAGDNSSINKTSNHQQPQRDQNV